MIVIKSPKFNICTCERCGTVFQPEAQDDLYYKFLPAEITPYKVYARCPTCEGYCEITVIEETAQNDK